MKKGLTQKAKQGGWPTKAPMGYLNKRERIGGREFSKVVLDPKRAMLVKQAFRLYSTGDYSLADVQDWLASKGFTSPYSKKGTPPPISAISKMLHNRFYIGVISWQGVEYKGEHKLLVSKALFDLVQDVARAHDRVGIRERRHDHYLKGKLFCGECGHRLSLTLAKGKYLYFFCLGQRNAFRKQTNCHEPYVMAIDTEELVEDLYKRIQLPSEWVERLEQELEDEAAERQNVAAELRVPLTKNLAALADERQKILRAYYANAIPLELLKSDQGRITAAEERAKADLAATEADLEGWQEVLKLAIKLAGSCHAAYLKAPPKVRRRFNEAVIKAIYIKDRKIARVEYTEVFEALFLGQGLNKTMKVGARGFEPRTSAV